MLLIAPVTIRASLQNLSGGATVEGLAAPVFNVGDGMQLDLYLIRGAARQTVGSRYFDPGRTADDRNWIPLAFPLALSGAGDDQLEIQLSAGPQGDLVGDWLALGSLRLVQRKTIP